mmetsp:Transcript_76256/g.203925  ORF Transcript_76256/g.203925 Transcript_76256/m.203925 type:complete len:341 (-) Transcript_76256:1492-2514(-)
MFVLNSSNCWTSLNLSGRLSNEATSTSTCFSSARILSRCPALVAPETASASRSWAINSTRSFSLRSRSRTSSNSRSSVAAAAARNPLWDFTLSKSIVTSASSNCSMQMFSASMRCCWMVRNTTSVSCISRSSSSRTDTLSLRSTSSLIFQARSSASRVCSRASRSVSSARSSVARSSSTICAISARRFSMVLCASARATLRKSSSCSSVEILTPCSRMRDSRWARASSAAHWCCSRLRFAASNSRRNCAATVPVLPRRCSRILTSSSSARFSRSLRSTWSRKTDSLRWKSCSSCAIRISSISSWLVDNAATWPKARRAIPAASSMFIAMVSSSRRANWAL